MAFPHRIVNLPRSSPGNRIRGDRRRAPRVTAAQCGVMRPSILRAATAAVVSLLALGFAAVEPPSEAAAAPHPHFPKTLTCAIPDGPKITIEHLTVTFDKEGAAKMKPGQAWHLAGATFETSADVVVGGRAVAAGKYALSARKAEKGGWVLTLHKGRGFSRPEADVAALATEFTSRTLKFEHLSCDIQPGGDKSDTRLFLDVRFDEMLARCLIELPKQ